MNKKVISLSLATIMMSQTQAYANHNRIDIVTSEAIAESKENLSVIKIELIKLNEQLGFAENLIKNRNNLNNRREITTVMFASLGVGFNIAMAVGLKGRSSITGVGLSAMRAATFSVLFAFTSLVYTASAKTYITDEDVIAIDVKLKDLSGAVKTTDQAESESLQKLGASIEKTRDLIRQYQVHKNEKSLNELYSNLALTLGTALTFAGLLTLNQKIILIPAAAISLIGNLSLIITSMDDSQAERLLKEISELREAVRKNIDTI